MQETNNGNDLKLDVAILNTDKITSRFSVVIENCNNGPQVKPSNTKEFSLKPAFHEFAKFTITAAVSDDEKEFTCKAVLYDSAKNKLDEKIFKFSATKESASIINVEGE